MQVVVLIALLISFGSAKYAWHSTSFQFEQMLEYDLEILEEILSTLHIHTTELEMMRKAVRSVQDKVNHRLSHIEEDFRHPISYFRLLDVLKETEAVPTLDRRQRIEEQIKVMDALRVFPNNNDRLIVLQNLYSMQKSNGLKTKDLAKGIIVGEYGHGMEPEDCEDMANIALSAHDYELFLSWANEALRMMTGNKKYSKTEQDLQANTEVINDTLACERICSEGREKVRSRRSLKCLMWDGNRDPWLVLQPIKMEVIDKDPHIYRFYDVISDKEIEALKSLSRRRLIAAKTAGDQFDPVRLDSPRVAHHFYPNSSDKIVARLNDRISHITGLDMGSSEELQVATYGIGGHYTPHYDAGNGTSYKERTATFMFYLSDVKDGGATVFIEPRVAVVPRKGSALLWYNLLPSGYLDERTKHCACRVLLGTKWIVNKWIHAEDLHICRKNEGLVE